MASTPGEAAGSGFELDPNGLPIETLREYQSETGGICVLSPNVAVGSQKDGSGDQDQTGDGDRLKEEKGDSDVDGKIVKKGDAFGVVESNGNEETEGALDLASNEEVDKKLEVEGSQNVQIEDQKGLENDQRYPVFLQEEKNGFSVDDLVWGKVKSHPWWPGQIFDPKYASEMALKRQKKDCFLVAYFGDKTFAWVPESQLKPFQADFPVMERQSRMEPFVNAVYDALDEVSRRIELGMACSCLAGEIFTNLKYKTVVNAGIREETCSAFVDRSLFVDAFQPERLLQYVRALARFPFGGFDKLELTSVVAQLKALYRFKGYLERPVLFSADCLMENDADFPLGKDKVSRKVTADNSTSVASSIKSGKRPRGRASKKQVLEDSNDQKDPPKLKEGEEVNLASSTPHSSGVKSREKPRGRPRRTHTSVDEPTEEGDADYTPQASSKKPKVIRSETAYGGRKKKTRGSAEVDSDIEAPSSARARSLRVGDRIRRVASQLKESPIGSSKRTDHSSRAAKRNEVAAQDYSSPSEMLSKLNLVASDPMEEYSFLSTVISFFTKFRDSLSSGSSKDQELGKSIGKKRGRKKKEEISEPASSEMSEPDYMLDSYWSDIILQSSPEREPVSRSRKRKGVSLRKRQKRTKSAGESLVSASVGLPLGTMNSQQIGSSNLNEVQEVKVERTVGNTEEKEDPTALILSFNEHDALPSAAELVKIFSPYGPLREEETEVLRKTNRAKVVFRYRQDAEKAFSSAGKYSVFGPALVSYRIRYSPSPRTSPAASPQDKNGASASKDELQGIT